MRQLSINGLQRRAIAGCLNGLGFPHISNNIFYGERIPGLRIAIFHGVGGKGLEKFKKLISHISSYMTIVSPDVISDLREGSYIVQNPEVVLTFDDGFRNNIHAARWLSKNGMKAIFFVVPSFIGRSMTDYVNYHKKNGVSAFSFMGKFGDDNGLQIDHVVEMKEAGHIIGGHPFAHRSLARLSYSQLCYEIDKGTAVLESIVEEPVQHFAIGFGRSIHISTRSYKFLKNRFPYIYMGIRHGNVGGRNRFLYRDNVNLTHPLNFIDFVLQGGADARYWLEKSQLEEKVKKINA